MQHCMIVYCPGAQALLFFPRKCSSETILLSGTSFLEIQNDIFFLEILCSFLIALSFTVHCRSDTVNV